MGVSDPSNVSDIFSQRFQTVYMHLGRFIVVVRILILNALDSLVELFQTARGPPVLPVAMEIVLPPVVVEPVRDLVAQNGPDSPELENPHKFVSPVKWILHLPGG